MRPPAADTDHCSLKSIVSITAPWGRSHPQKSSTEQGEPEAELPQERQATSQDSHNSNSWNNYPPIRTTNSEEQLDQQLQVSATTCEKSSEILCHAAQ